jgi:periplasmic protein TonB
MNNTFKYAVIISFVVHFLAIAPLYGFELFNKSTDPKKTMVVEYVTLKEAPPVDMTKFKVIEPPKMELLKDVAMKTGARKTESKKDKPAPEPKDNIKRISSETGKQEARAIAQAAHEAKIRSTKDYINYYQLIREKIRQGLKENYRYYYNEGDVSMVFVLRQDGALISSGVDASNSADNDKLRRIALESLKGAAPFPTFPKALNVPSMAFSVTVSFKKD